jgi:prepilin-type N-terminal cleavage/methylation domain-containing protein
MKMIDLKLTHRRPGFSLVEVIVSMLIIGIIAVSIFSIQTASWKKTTNSNRMLVAGHMIEKQIELMRMNIDQNQALNFPPLSGSLSDNGVQLTWTISDATRPTGGTNSNTRKCDFVAVCGTGKDDTLKVTTYLSKMF